MRPMAAGDDLVDLLARLGFRTLGAFAELPARRGARPLRTPRHARAPPRAREVEHEPVATVPPDELLETIELDPPATRVDEAAFAAKMLADRLLARLDALGLCCARVVVEAETEHGEHFSRTWRHEGALTPAALVTRLRWQLDAWLLTGTVTAGISRLVLAPDDLGPAVGRQLGFWGGDPAAADRAGRALTRVQGMLGPDAVVTAVDGGGRTPAERIRWVPWGEPRDPPERERSSLARRGAGPAPARVFDPPVAAELLDADGAPIAVSGRGEPSAPPAGLRCGVLPDGGGPLVSSSGPWAHDLRWWDARRRRARCGRWWSRAAPAVPRRPRTRPRRGRSRLRLTVVLGIEHVARPRPAGRDDVARVHDATDLEREASASDAPLEPVAQPFELGDLGVEPGTPRRRQPVPVPLRRRVVIGERRERLADLPEGEPDLLRDADERHAADHVAVVPALTAGGAHGVHQPLRLVEPQRRRRHSGPVAHRADGQQLGGGGHGPEVSEKHLTSSELEVVR